jgi:hypothetical protein
METEKAKRVRERGGRGEGSERGMEEREGDKETGRECERVRERGRG